MKIKLFLKISVLKNFENFSLKKSALQAARPATFLKRDSHTSFFL